MISASIFVQVGFVNHWTKRVAARRAKSLRKTAGSDLRAAIPHPFLNMSRSTARGPWSPKPMPRPCDRSAKAVVSDLVNEAGFMLALSPNSGTCNRERLLIARTLCRSPEKRHAFPWTPHGWTPLLSS